MRFTPQEYYDMVVAYGLAGENARAAARIYAERFPRRERHPTGRQISRILRQFQETGCLVHNHSVVGPVGCGVRDEEAILQAVYETPRISVRRLAHDVNMSRTTVHRILRVNGLHPFHYQRVQQQLQGDAQRRINFCEGFLAQCRQNESFPDYILWSDEATFTPNGVLNSRNFLYWAEENPHVIREGAFQYRWSLNVWAGIIGNQVIGPYFFPPRLNGDIYAEFVQNQLPVLLADVPLHIRTQLIYQHDGAPAHFCRRVRDALNANYPERWIGQGGPITWPPRSPDLNVLDFFVWGYIKSRVEHCRNGTANEVREAIVAAFNTITPDMAHRATRNIVRRAELCIQERGQHFEQFLH